MGVVCFDHVTVLCTEAEADDAVGDMSSVFELHDVPVLFVQDTVGSNPVIYELQES